MGRKAFSRALTSAPQTLTHRQRQAVHTPDGPSTNLTIRSMCRRHTNPSMASLVRSALPPSSWPRAPAVVTGVALVGVVIAPPSADRIPPSSGLFVGTARAAATPASPVGETATPPRSELRARLEGCATSLTSVNGVEEAAGGGALATAGTEVAAVRLLGAAAVVATVVVAGAAGAGVAATAAATVPRGRPGLPVLT